MWDSAVDHPRGAAGWSIFLACVLLPVTGCSLQGAAADTQGSSTRQQVGIVELQDLLLVTASNTTAGRILGTLINDSTGPVEVMISDTDENFTVIVPARGNYSFATNAGVLDTVNTRPGETVAITVTTAAASTMLEIPVVDGNQDPYTPYSPD